MNSTFRKKPNEFKNQKPVVGRGNVLTMLKKQIEGKECPICNEKINLASFALHRKSCKLREDDEDIEVIDVLDAEEKSRRRGLNAVTITLNDSLIETTEEIVVLKEEPEEPDVVIEDDQVAGTSNVIEESDTAEAQELAEPIFEEAPRSRRRPAKNNVNNEPTVIEDARRTRMTRRSLRATQNSSFCEETIVETTQKETTTRSTRRRTKATLATEEAQNPENGDAQLQTQPSTSRKRERPTPIRPRVEAVHSSKPKSPRTALKPTEIIEETPEKHVTDALIKEERLAGLADKLANKCDTLLRQSIQNYYESQRSQKSGGEEPHSENESLHYTVEFMLKIIRRVLTTPTSYGWRYDEKYWLDDLFQLERLLSLSPRALRLFMRLFLRKRRWLSMDHLAQRNDVGETSYEAEIQELATNGFIDTEQHLTELEVALTLCSLEKVKIVAKKFQVDHHGQKNEIIAELIKRSRSQRSLFGAKTAVTRMLMVVKETVGLLFRINEGVSNFFKAVLTLYCPSSMNSCLLIDNANTNLAAQMMLAMLNLKAKKLDFPAPNPCNEIISIFPSKNQLYSYVSAKEMEAQIILLAAEGRHDAIAEVADQAAAQLHDCIEKEAQIFRKATALPEGLRRFTPFWVWVRCLAHGAVALEKLKKFEGATVTYQNLLRNKDLVHFCVHERGIWWDRLALNLHSHLNLKDDAAEACQQGIDDELVLDKERLMLQDRLSKLTKGNYQPSIVISAPIEKKISAPVLIKDTGNGRLNQFIVKEPGNVLIVSVEEVALRYYKEQEHFATGLHCEGTIWHLMLGLLFYDIIYSHEYKDVWLSELQAAPIDLNYRDLYERRKSSFDDRLCWLKKATAEEYTSFALERLTEFAQSADDFAGSDPAIYSPEVLMDFCQVLTGQLLSAICGRVLKDRRNTRSGFPDLTVWDAATGRLAVVEVKGPGDRLSTKQRLWLDFFTNNGVRAEVCYVSAIREK